MPKLVSVKKMIAIEQAQVALGTSLEQLMRNAGKGLAEVIDTNLQAYHNSRTILALVGSGNNGGDALVALTHLAAWDWDCVAWIIGKREANDSLINEVKEAGVKVLWAEPRDLEALFDNTIVLDGILGTGFKLPLRVELNDLMSRIKLAIRKTYPIVIAVDCPSGVDCDSGETAESVIPADQTVCMAAIKKGLFKFPAVKVIGQVETIPIGITEANEEWNSALDEVLDPDSIQDMLPKRELNSHKGVFGKVLISGGCVEYPGAPVLSGKGAYSVGAGLVRIATTSISQNAFASILPEAVWAILPDEDGYLCSKSYEKLATHLNGQDVFVLGPGLGNTDGTHEYVEKIILSIDQFDPYPRMVIDADGLRAAASITDWHHKIPAGSVITPHPGEFQAIKGSLDLDGSDRMENAKFAARAWGCVVVLKGAMTVIADPKGRSTTVPFASSALAKAGTGDVLAGMIAGFIAQGMESYQAAIVGVATHALAGIIAANALKNDRSVMASDLRKYIGEVLQTLNIDPPNITFGLGI